MLLLLIVANIPCKIILYLLMGNLIGCVCKCCCNNLCCECNQYIFPAPASQYTLNHAITQQNIMWQFKSFISEGRRVPFVEISNDRSRKEKKCFIYFHGNGEDIGYLGFFLQPIVDAINISFYAIEYPSYGQYNTLCPVLISNRIKADSLNFYDFLRSSRGKEDVWLMGRSIGSGGATYLAANRPVPMLILMSPFDTVRRVAQRHFGCKGSLVKEHFDNLQEIVKFEGKLLVIHGQKDQVINISHAKNLVRQYETRNSYKNRATAVYPQQMTHNRFSIKQDVIDHIRHFISQQ